MWASEVMYRGFASRDARKFTQDATVRPVNSVSDGQGRNIRKAARGNPIPWKNLLVEQSPPRTKLPKLDARFSPRSLNVAGTTLGRSNRQSRDHLYLKPRARIFYLTYS